MRALAATALAAGVALAGASARADPPKLSVYMGLVETRDPQAAQGLQEWAQAFELGVDATLFDVMHSYYGNRHVRVLDGPLPGVPQPGQLAQLWKDQEALYVLSAIAAQDGQTTNITSQVYLGDFHGTLAPVLILKQVVKRKNYEASQAALRAVTLYGLGEEAAAQHRVPTACAIFKEAAGDLAHADVQAMGIAALPGALRDAMRIAKCA